MSKIGIAVSVAVLIFAASLLAQPGGERCFLEYFSLSVSQLADTSLIYPVFGGYLYFGALPGYYLMVDDHSFYVGEMETFSYSNGNFFFVPFKTPQISFLAILPDEYFDYCF